MFDFNIDKSKKDFYYPLEIKIYREILIKEKVNEKGKLSSKDYERLLFGISIDVYDGIDNLKEWHTFSFKGSLYAYSSLGIFIPRFKKIRNLTKNGFQSERLVVDNYKKVLTGIEITNDTRSLNDVKILIQQLYNAEKYSSNYSKYMSDLKRIITTKSFNDTCNEDLVLEMQKRRDKVLSLEKSYSLNKK